MDFVDLGLWTFAGRARERVIAKRGEDEWRTETKRRGAEAFAERREKPKKGKTQDERQTLAFARA